MPQEAQRLFATFGSNTATGEPTLDLEAFTQWLRPPAVNILPAQSLMKLDDSERKRKRNRNLPPRPSQQADNGPDALKVSSRDIASSSDPQGKRVEGLL
jgi:hypothetical protein